MVMTIGPKVTYAIIHIYPSLQMYGGRSLELPCHKCNLSDIKYDTKQCGREWE